MNRSYRYRLFGLITLITAVMLAAMPTQASFRTLESGAQVSPAVARWLATAAPNDTLAVLVTLRDDGAQLQADQGVTFANLQARRAHVHQTLRGRADRNAQAVNALFAKERAAVSFQSFMTFNGIALSAPKRVIEVLRTASFVAAIEPDAPVFLQQPLAGVQEPQVNAVEWNIAKIGADRAWSELGINGSGIVVGGMDTGVRYTHEVLRGNYKCAGMTNHSACWLDTVNSRTEPYDDHNHGTHTMATVAGANGIGVAPGAKWIACKGLSGSGSGTSSGLLRCFDFFLAPGGSSANAPDVVNNSWGSNDGSSTSFQQAVRNWVNAGIFPTFSNGNSGPSCNTVGSPASYPESFGVGSTDSSDAISSFSSRGPSPLGGTKPQVSAPGSNVRSAIGSGDTSYGSMSGTSMAGPHVAGLVALILDANSSLTVDQLKQNMQSNALGISSTACGSSGIPNNTFGYGRIRAYESVRAAMGGVTPTPVTRTPTPSTVTPTPVTITPTPGGSTVFSDNFETNMGWVVNAGGTDTATTGRWERGDPEQTDYNGPKQLGTTASGMNDLVTGRLAGSSVGDYDIDGGVTSIRSPSISLPSGANLTLTLRYYLAYTTNASSADYFRVKIVGSTTTTVFERLASATDVDAAWQTATVNLTSYAGQTVRIQIEAADASTGSLVESAADDVRITC